MLKIHGHADVCLLDGGRQKWLAEGRPLSAEKAVIQSTQYVAKEPDWNLRADKDYVLSVIGQSGHTITDARSVNMYMDGHISSAVNVPASPLHDAEGDIIGWQTPTTRSDGTFKSVEELQALFAENQITPEKNIVTYCVRGGLSTHMWFVLTQLLGYPNVREYDRSWEEWGSLPDAPIEK
jgi:thiosulfate/3-mercaptopyruvate sulfurtransferase